MKPLVQVPSPLASCPIELAVGCGGCTIWYRTARWGPVCVHDVNKSQVKGMIKSFSFLMFKGVQDAETVSSALEKPGNPAE